MPVGHRKREGMALPVLHGAFALTGLFQAIGGALLPSLAPTFHMNDAQNGLLYLLYFIGTAVGALLCVGRYAQLMATGFALAALSCAGIAIAQQVWLMPLFFALGVGVGVPMSAVSIFAGRKFGERSAAPLTFLNFSWSAGALLAPLLAAQVLRVHTYREAYAGLCVAAAIAAAACRLVLRDPPARPAPQAQSGLRNVRWIALFAVLTFLEVGIENTTATWLATFALRSSGAAPALAAASSSFYWCGFLISRGLFALVLLRHDSRHVLRGAVIAATVAAALLIALPGPVERGLAMLVLGAALAPIFPLLLARFFARARRASDSRWVLSVCGFGGSVLPWLTGWISATSTLRTGLATVPAALVCMIAMLPATGGKSDAAGDHAV
jgi:fucose permease